MEGEEREEIKQEKIEERNEDLESLFEEYSLTEEQRQLFHEFKEQCRKEESLVSDKSLIRYLTLCKFDIKDAMKVKQTLEGYKKEFADISDELIIKEIKTNKILFGGRDKDGRKIIHFNYKLHIPSDQPINCTMKYFLYMMDLALDDATSVKSGFTFICWMEGSGWQNFDFQAEIKMNHIFNSFSPMTLNMLGKIYLVDSPWYVRFAMAMMRPFVAKEVMDKLVLCTNEDLVNHIPAESLATNDEFLESVEKKGLDFWI